MDHLIGVRRLLILNCLAANKLLLKKGKHFIPSETQPSLGFAGYVPEVVE